jgi:hypothetical protein
MIHDTSMCVCSEMGPMPHKGWGPGTPAAPRAWGQSPVRRHGTLGHLGPSLKGWAQRQGQAEWAPCPTRAGALGPHEPQGPGVMVQWEDLGHRPVEVKPNEGYLGAIWGHFDVHSEWAYIPNQTESP